MVIIPCYAVPSASGGLQKIYIIIYYQLLLFIILFKYFIRTLWNLFLKDCEDRCLRSRCQNFNILIGRFNIAYKIYKFWPDFMTQYLPYALSIMKKMHRDCFVVSYQCDTEKSFNNLAYHLILPVSSWFFVCRIVLHIPCNNLDLWSSVP